ncbi:MAG TPA: ribose 5-phosphate isomerase B [Pelolinea sp.]|nr:ribose 5-phosphate isomerase B [Pelolinea sp.]
MADKNKPIIIGADHLGLPLKNALKDYLLEKGYKVDDIGVNSEDPVNYPDIAVALAEQVSQGKYDRGILVCGTGIGMAITANKIPGVRAAVIHDSYSAERARASNDAQVATFGSLVVGVSTAKKNLDIWLENEFGGGRSQPKVDIIKALDEKKLNK